MNIQYYSGVLASVIRGITLAFKTYKNRVLADLGIVTSDSNTIAYMKMSKQQSIDKSIKFAWLGEAGSTIRTSGIYSYFTKLYSLLTTNDATQTTSTSQPFVGGNIAPNEKLRLKNCNGQSNYLTHPTITFLSTDAWSITTVLNTDGSDVNNMYYASGVTTKFSNFYYSTAKFRFFNSLGTIYLSTNIINGQIIGKNCVVTRVADGLGNLKTYINGIFLETQSAITSIELTKILDTTSGNTGTISSHIIRLQALTSTQVLTEATFLKSLYPDIPSVTIGSQVWATSNCDMVCTSQGNLIPEVQLNSGTELIPTINLNVGWSALGTATIISNNSFTTSVNSGFNSILLTVGKRYIMNYSVTSTTTLNVYNSGSVIDPILSGIPFVANNAMVYFRGTGIGTHTINSISLIEIGWANSQLVYDSVYTATTGTTEQKTYAAVKVAAMWSYYNNDSTVGSVYGKLYNWFAVKLMQMDIDYYNVANPTALWGWKVPSSTDYTTLQTTLGGASVAGGRMKKEGLTYWSTPNLGADNSSGFSAIGGGYRLSNGNFGGSVIQTRFWGLDTFRLAVDNASTVSDISSGILLHGVSLRMIKN